MRGSSPVGWTEFTTRDDGPLIAGRRAGNGPPVLLLHGGPGIGFDYLRDLADELAQENDVAWYQQRGLEPSAAEGPYTVAADVGDARRVPDALGWQQAYVVGHSWGGHLALHLAEAMNGAAPRRACRRPHSAPKRLVQVGVALPHPRERAGVVVAVRQRVDVDAPERWPVSLLWARVLAGERPEQAAEKGVVR